MKLTRLRNTIPAGLLDAGSASLATFSVQLYAVRQFAPTDLGVYALFLTAFLWAAIVTQQSVFVPAEAWAIAHYDRDRVRIVHHSIRLAWRPLLLAPVIVALAWVAAPVETSSSLLFGLGITATATAVFSPVQDHVRRVLHLSGTSGRAAAVSIVQFCAAVTGLTVLHYTRVPQAWIPLGALMGANILSLCVGLNLCWGKQAGAAHNSPVFRQLVRSGRWLLLGSVLVTAAEFGSATLVSRLAGSAALGFAEAARVVSQPVLVMAMGLSAVFSPRSMEAAARREWAEAHRLSRLFLLLIFPVGLIYLLCVAMPWRWNPMPLLVPNAYLVPWLVALTVVASSFKAVMSPYFAEHVGARRTWPIPVFEGLGSCLQLAVAATAAHLRSFALPLALLVFAATKWAGLAWSRRQIYLARSGSSADLSARSLG